MFSVSGSLLIESGNMRLSTTSLFFALFASILGSGSLSYGQQELSKVTTKAKAPASKIATKLASKPTVKTATKPVTKPVSTTNVEESPAQKDLPKTTSTISTTGTSLAVKPKLEKLNAESPYSISAAMSGSRSLNDFQDGTRSDSVDFEMIPAYKWKYGLSRAILTYSHDPKDNQNSDIGDIAFAHGFKPIDFERLQLGPAVSAILPESKKSRELRNLEAAAGVSMTVGIQERLLMKGFYIKTGLSFNQNFHRYETALDGSLNNKYSSRQSIYSGYAYEQFAFDVEFHHINAWSYLGTNRESFEHAEELSVMLAKHYSLALGHTNSGSVFRANATDSNVRLIDERSSLVYAKIGIRY